MIMKAKEENTFRNNIVAANLFPHKLLKMAAWLIMAVAKMAVGVILWAGYFVLSLVANIAGGIIQLAVGCIIVLASVAAFFGLIIWLLTL